MSPELISQIYKDAKALNAERNQISELEKETRRREFQRRLQESRHKCESCGAIRGWEYESLERHQNSCVVHQKKLKEQEEYTQLRRNTAAKYNRLLNHDIQSIVTSIGVLADTINTLRFEESEARYNADSTNKKPVLEAIAEVKESYKQESQYEHKRRYQQIEVIKDFSNKLLNLYDRLDSEESELAVDNVEGE